jgi:hypothetical protein
MEGSLRDFGRTVKRKSKLLIRSDLCDSQDADAAGFASAKIGGNAGNSGLCTFLKMRLSR